MSELTAPGNDDERGFLSKAKEIARNADERAGIFVQAHPKFFRFVADVLPVLRAEAGPILAIHLLQTPPEKRTWKLTASVLGIEMTDFVDGWIARKLGTTEYGGKLDQIADKIFVTPVLVALALNGEISPAHPALKGVRDWKIQAERNKASELGVNVDAQDLGKYKAWFEFAGVALAASPLSHTHPQLMKDAFLLGTGMSMISAADYMKNFKEATKNTPLHGLEKLIEPSIEQEI